MTNNITNNKTKSKPKPVANIKKSPSSYHHGDLKQALIETGLLVIREQGAHALSLREAARKAGVSEAAPYRHFSNKESLLAAIAEEGFRRLKIRMLAGIESAGSEPLAQLHAMSWAYADFALQETDHFQAMFSSSLVPPHAEKHPSLSEMSTSCFTEVVKAVEACQKTGVILKDAHPQATASRLWGSIHGMTILLAGHQRTSAPLHTRPA
jgi:AcrR family transcriptional regulator